MKNLNKAILIALGMALPLGVMASPDDDVTIRMMEVNEHAAEAVTNHIELPEAADDHHVRDHAANGTDLANGEKNAELDHDMDKENMDKEDRDHEANKDDNEREMNREESHEREMDREDEREREVETDRDDRKDVEHEGIDREEVQREGPDNIDHESNNDRPEVDAPEQDLPGQDFSGPGDNGPSSDGDSHENDQSPGHGQ